MLSFMSSNNWLARFQPRVLKLLLANANAWFKSRDFYTWLSCIIFLAGWLQILSFRNYLGTLWTITFLFLLIIFGICTGIKSFLLRWVCCRTVGFFRQAGWCGYWWKSSFLWRSVCYRRALIVDLDGLSGWVKGSNGWLMRYVICGKLLDILAADDLPWVNSDWIVIVKRLPWYYESFEGAIYSFALWAHEFSDLWWFF